MALHTFCVMEGRRQTTLNWCWADKLKGEVYLNLHNESHQLVRIAPGEVEVCLNGDNPAQVLLGEAYKMLPIEYQPDATPREAVELLKELVIDALACRPRNRLLLTSWLLSAFFLDFAPHKGMMKLSGPTKSGKSTAGQILTTLLYGTAQVENPTVAYSYTDTSRNPLLVCDNMENQQLTLSVIQFLLGVATGASRSKREAGTRDGVVREPVHALVALTAIEPLPKSELINRFYEVEFDKIFKRGGFLPDVHLKRLEAARNRILSGLFQLFSREVLPGFLSGRQTLMHRLEANFPEHSKDRTNSFLTIVVLIMRSLLKLLEGLADPDPRTWEILTEVIKEQGEIAEDTERETNPATYLLDALAHEVRTKGSGLVDKQYYVQSQAVVDEAGELKEVHLVAPAKDFYLAFVTLSRNRGYAVPFLNAKSLMARINSEKEALAASGWRWCWVALCFVERISSSSDLCGLRIM